jgi:hypothetical protein
MRIVGLAVLASALAGCGAASERPGPLVRYDRQFGGVVGGSVQLTVGRDGHVTGRHNIGGGTPIDVHLRPEELERIEHAVDRARDARPRRREEPSSEAPRVRLVLGDVELRYVGFAVVPDAALPLVHELDRVTSNALPGPP